MPHKVLPKDTPPRECCATLVTPEIPLGAVFRQVFLEVTRERERLAADAADEFPFPGVEFRVL